MLKERARDKTLILDPSFWDRWRIRLEEDLKDQVLDETHESLGLKVAIGRSRCSSIAQVRCNVITHRGDIT